MRRRRVKVALPPHNFDRAEPSLRRPPDLIEGTKQSSDPQGGGGRRLASARVKPARRNDEARRFDRKAL
jgi:hypothetical protein